MSDPNNGKGPVVQIADVSRRFGVHWALARVSMSVAVGECVLLMGGNGAGKSTLLRIVATLLAPTRGSLSLFGMSPRSDLPALRRRVGLLPPRLGLYEDLTAMENLRVRARLAGRPYDRLPALLEKVGLSPRLSRPVRVFSSGMRKRLALACLLEQEPDLVLLDEPHAALDTDGAELVDQLVVDWRRQGRTVIVASHDIERVAAYCDRALHLKNGRLIWQGPGHLAGTAGVASVNPGTATATRSAAAPVDGAKR